MSRQRKRWTPREIQQIMEMRRNCMRYYEIGQHFGVTGQAIINALHRRGLGRDRLPLHRLSDTEYGSRRWYRLKAGLTIREVCDQTGITRETIIRWEKGGNISQIEMVRSVCKLLGCTVSQYLGQEIVFGRFSAK